MHIAFYSWLLLRLIFVISINSDRVVFSCLVINKSLFKYSNEYFYSIIIFKDFETSLKIKEIAMF